MRRLRPQISEYLITPPDVAAVTLDECKAGLGISGAGSDAMLGGVLAAAAGIFDPATGGWLRRALRPQTWELRTASFDCGSDGDLIALPYPVLTQVVSVKYDDAAGIERTLVEGDGFKVYGLNGHDKAHIAPVGSSWPATAGERESVRIRFICGYAAAVPADGDAPARADKLPAPIKSAIILGTRMLLSNVERNLTLAGEKIEGIGEWRYVVSEAANRSIENATCSLLSTYRVFT